MINYDYFNVFDCLPGKYVVQINIFYNCTIIIKMLLSVFYITKIFIHSKFEFYWFFGTTKCENKI